MTFHLDVAGECRFERAADPDAARWLFRQYDAGPDHLVALACPPLPQPLAVEWREFHAGGQRPMSLRIATARRSSGQEQRAQP